MTLPIAAGVAAFLVAGFILLPVKLEGTYTGGMLSLVGYAGPVRMSLLPRKREKAARAEDQAERDAARLCDRISSREILWLLVDNGCRAMGRLMRYVRVQTMRAYFTAGGDDPYRAALAYVRAGVAMEALAARYERADLRADVDFNGPTVFDGQLCLKARMGNLIGAAVCFGTGYLRGYFRYRRKAKTEG